MAKAATAGVKKTVKPRAAPNPLAPRTGAERGLVRAALADGLFDATPLTPAQRVVRPSFLRALISGKIPGAPVPEGGFTARGLIFRHPLDLSHASAQGDALAPLALVSTRFEQALQLDFAHFAMLGLLGSTSDGTVSMQGLRVAGDLRMDRFTCTGGVDLIGAAIGGDLTFNGSKLRGPVDKNDRVVGDALIVDRSKVGGNFTCRTYGDQRFEADGEVRLLAVEIGGQLSFKGARLKGVAGPDGVIGHALSADGVIVTQQTFLDDDFRAEGAVRLPGATLQSVMISGVVISRNEAIDLSDARMGRLHVRLIDRKSRGRFVLEGTTVDTIDALHPVLWGTPPAEDGSGIRLDLDGFTYRRAEVAPMHGRRSRTWARFLGRDPLAEAVLEFLDRNFRSPRPNREHYQPQPFEQAAQALRDAGHGQAANEVAVAKREFQRVCKANGPAASIVAWFSLVLFRYGYGPLRATGWTVALILAGAWAIAAVQEGGGLVLADKPQPGSQPPAFHEMRSGPCRLTYLLPDATGCARTAAEGLSASMNAAERYVFSPVLDTALGTPSAAPVRTPTTAQQSCPEHPLALALDAFLPLVDFGVEKRCRIADDYPRRGLAEAFRILYAIFGWLFIPMVALTFSGVLRKD